MLPEHRQLLMRSNRLLGAGLVEANLVKIEDLEKANEKLLEIMSQDQPRQSTVLGIHELMVTNDELVEGINKKTETSELKRIAMRGGMKTLHQDSMMKVKEGITTLAEALATVPQDMELREGAKR